MIASFRKAGMEIKLTKGQKESAAAFWIRRLAMRIKGWRESSVISFAVTERERKAK